jgi:DNA-binding MarR family transcriptional regulator
MERIEMNRKEILKQLWESQDEAYVLMTEYDSLPHYYGTDVLYQAEAYIVNHIGKTPNITITELAEALKKTPSACSQIVRKLIDKGLVLQRRNTENKRLYNLRLTADGEKVYKDHISFNEKCQEITFNMLSEFTDEELKIYLSVQRRINEAYRGDVQRSKEKYGAE